MDVTKPYKFIRFGAMDVTKPHTFKGFGAMEVTKPYKFIRFVVMDVTKPCKLYRVWGHQRLKDASHDGWFGPGRAGGTLKSAIRMLATALKGASSNLKPRTTAHDSSPEGGQQQLKGTSHDGWLGPGLQTRCSHSQSLFELQHIIAASSS